MASLPVEERATVAEAILRSLNPPESEIDREWTQVAERRLAELRSGQVRPVPREQVFAKVRKRFEKGTSPNWHRDILEERKRKIDSGRAEFISLDKLRAGCKP